MKTLRPNSAFRLPPVSSCGRADSRPARPSLRVLLVLRVLALATLACAAQGLHSQTAANPSSPAASSPTSKVAISSSADAKIGAAKVSSIKSFRIIQEKGGPAVEILSTSPLVPAIQQIDNPPRLVIDLPNARLDVPHKRVVIQADQINALRADQFQQNPPIARVVVDLVAQRTYTWDAAGNRLVVHLGKNPAEASHSPFQAPNVPALTSAPQPVVKAVRAAGPLALAANTGAVGSSFTAGEDTALLSLSTGGEVRVGPGTTLSITPSQNRHNLMLGLNTGALEAHLDLDASTDSVMTPDFRIMLVGPGEFHYAFSADNQGNTCVRALPGNTASAIVTELLGDRTYQVKATDQLVFRAGQLDRVDMAVPLECGCPPPRLTVQRATNDLPVQDSAAAGVRPPVHANPAPQPPTSHVENPAPAEVPAGDSPPSSPEKPPAEELHVQVSAPLVFRATGPPPQPVEDVRALPLGPRPTDPPELTPVAPPATKRAAKPAGTQIASADRPHGFFHKVGSFFAALFR